MANFNKIIMMGNLTKDPDYKQLGNGQTVCKLTIANNRNYKNKQTGAVAQEVCFVEVDVWGPQAEHCRQYLQKGRPVLVEGRLKQSDWKDAEGKQRSKHSIVSESVVFLGNNHAGESSASADTGGAQRSSLGEIAFKEDSPFEDDLPF